MKSALELAMEKSARLTGDKKLSEAQKKEIAELRRIGEAKIAEAEIMCQKKLGETGGDPAAAAALAEQLRRDREKINEQTERKIAGVRGE
ncbi:MAG: hypothetical protein HY804_07395 [Nitrospinae bacterium]|nr:hypothetical protein [Nitrospinota bacterium]